MKRRYVTWSITAVVLAMAFLAAVATGSAYHNDREAAYARISTGSRLINTACGPIEFASAGTGPPVLMVHGAGGGFDQGLEQALPLVEQGYRVIAVSRFGYLRTPLPMNATPTAQADAHACLLDALHIEHAAVVGGSAGAPSSMQFCLRYPTRCNSLVLVVPLVFAPPAAGDAAPIEPPPFARFVIETTLRSNFIFWLTLRVAPMAMVESLLATPSEDVHGASPDEQHRVFQVLRHILPVSERQKGLLNDSSIAVSLPRYDLERISAPTLVISVENDLFGTFRPARYTAMHLPNARFVGYRSGGHLWVGHQRELWSEVEEFLGSWRLNL